MEFVGLCMSAWSGEQSWASGEQSSVETGKDVLIIDCLVLTSITGVANAVPAPVRELTVVQATRRLAHLETNSPSSKNQPLLPTYIFPPWYFPILSWCTGGTWEVQRGRLVLFPIHSWQLSRFIRIFSTDSFVLVGWVFADGHLHLRSHEELACSERANAAALGGFWDRRTRHVPKCE